jgi:hypothetical protein
MEVGGHLPHTPDLVRAQFLPVRVHIVTKGVSVFRVTVAASDELMELPQGFNVAAVGS